MIDSHPILSCAASADWEKKLLGDSEERAWAAMQAAGRAIGRSVLRDADEMGGVAKVGQILVLVGKGHNGGDALIAAGEIFRTNPEMRITVALAGRVDAFKPLTGRAFRDLGQLAGDRMDLVEFTSDSGSTWDRDAARVFAADRCYDICLDGLLGMSFRPPFRGVSGKLVRSVNEFSGIRLRAAVDLPSGVGDESEMEPFRADFTYATGILKAPVFGSSASGRIRYLDLDFFLRDEPEANSRVLCQSILDPLRSLRPANCDKRDFGHLFVLSGSTSMPGAVLMAVQSALRSGVGLVTAFVPESLVTVFAARAPEAMWVAWPETPDGYLALEGRHLLFERLGRCTALLMGPGIGRSSETLTLVHEILRTVDVPVVLDADTLQRELVEKVLADRDKDAPPVVLTPHGGEFHRLAGVESSPDALLHFVEKFPGLTAVLKGPVTWVSDGAGLWASPYGGPVLARGGSGDVLAGLVAARVATVLEDRALAEEVCRAVVWHGMAADALARRRGQVSVCTGDLIDGLGGGLRSDS